MNLDIAKADSLTPTTARLAQRSCVVLSTLVVIAFFSWGHPAASATLEFAGRTWTIKQANTPVGPGPNRFSDNPSDVWADQEGLHLSIHKSGPFWYSTEVILNESLGYGTYVFQTNSRQDTLNTNAVFGAFTWDSTGGSPIPGNANREIDFEDARFGNAADPTNAQVVVQPFDVPGNLQRLSLPDLSENAALTRFFTWSPGKVEFTTLRGHRTPANFSPEEVLHQYTYLDNGSDHRVPIPHRENFRFNLWLFQSDAPVNDEPVEVLVNDFQYFPLPPGENTSLFDFESGSQGWRSFGAITTASGELPNGGSVEQGRFHTADFSIPDAGNFGIVDVSPPGQDLSSFVGLSVDAAFKDVDGQPAFVGVKELDIAVETPTGEEFFAPKVTMADQFQTLAVAFEDFRSVRNSLPPTPTQLSDVTIKLVVLNTNGTGVAQLAYDQFVGLRSIASPSAADFNQNGVVDAADYTVWRDTLGASGQSLAADGNRDSVVDSNDYEVWRSNFGVTTATSFSAENRTAVPEPLGGFAVVLLVFATVSAQRKRTSGVCLHAAK